jgi:LCP family protein required for cell wall assembly
VVTARASRQRRPLVTARGVALVLTGFLLAGLAGAGAYFAPVLAAAVSITGGPAVSHSTTPTPTTAAAAAPAPAGNVQPFTVLLLGSDDDQKFDPNHVLTQSMILVRVDPALKAVTMLSIPRDLYVPLASGGSNKIDAAYSSGGARTAVRTVEENFQVHVDNYVWIGLKGLIQLIDSLGGIDVVTSNPVMDDFYPNDINSSNPYGIYRVGVLPGPQHLDGIHAMQYVRSRHSDQRGDFGRSQRQQQVLLALRAKAKYLNPANLPDLATAFNGELKTDISLPEIRALLPIASQIQPQSVKQIVLLGSYTYSQVIGGEDALVPVWSLIRPLVHQYFP